MKIPATTLRAHLGLLVFSAFATAASGQSILFYDLSSVPSGTNGSHAATTVASGLTAGDLVQGSGINETSLLRGFSANTWTNNSDHPTPPGPMDPTRENAIANNDYYQFGFSVDSGFSASLSTLDVSLRRSSPGAADNFEWRFSLDGFATPGTKIADFTYFGRASAVGTTGATDVAENFNYMSEDVAAQGEGNPMPTLDLTGFSDLQDIQEGTAVTFRLYGWGADRNSRTVAIGRNDGPMLTGTVIPEPSTYALLFGLGALGVAVAIRRRKL